MTWQPRLQMSWLMAWRCTAETTISHTPALRMREKVVGDSSMSTCSRRQPHSAVPKSPAWFSKAVDTTSRKSLLVSFFLIMGAYEALGHEPQ